MHIYLALAIDRFSASGWKQKSFSLEWKEIYLLWIQGQDAIELMPAIGYFHPYRPCPCCPVTGSLSAPQKPLLPWQPPLLLASRVTSQRQSVFRGRALLTPTAIQWDLHSYRAHLPSGPWLQRHPAALLHWCQAPRVWRATGHMRMDMRVTPRRVPVRWCGSTSTGCSGTLLHPLLPCQQKLVPSAWCSEWAKTLCTATVRQQAGSKQKAWIGVVFLWMQNIPHEAWISGHVVSWLAGCLPSSSPPERQQECMEGHETMCGHTRALQPDSLAPGGQPFVTNTCQSSLAWHRHSLPDSTGPLHSFFSPRSHQTFLGSGSPFLPPASSTSQPSLAVLVQSPPLWEKQAVKLAVLCCREVESWPGEHLPGSGAGCHRWLLACTACTWVGIAQASSSGLEEAKVMLVFLERPCWGRSRYGEPQAGWPPAAFTVVLVSAPPKNSQD